jgi:hypothetical protein
MGCMSKMPSSSPQSAACSTAFWANYFFYHGVHLVDRPYRGRALEDRVRVGPPARVPEPRACGPLRLEQEPPPYKALPRRVEPKCDRWRRKERRWSFWGIHSSARGHMLLVTCAGAGCLLCAPRP